MPELSAPAEASLPPGVHVGEGDDVREYVRARLVQHTDDVYAGVPISKFPEDLRVYEHLLWLSGANTVIELGAQYGGSTLCFRDRLRAFARYRRSDSATVIAVDVDIELARAHISAADPTYGLEIRLVAGDVADPGLPAHVTSLLPPGARCLVIEDSAHTHASTLAALDGFACFVPPGGLLVVEDGVVDNDALRVDETWPRGVRAAVAEWLTAGGRDFRVRRDLELYGVTCQPGGFLQRAG